MERAVDTTPLLAEPKADPGQIQALASECKLQEKCFLSDGAVHGSEGYRKVQRKLVTACILCFVFMAIEVVGGYFAKSVAIMSDAAHMLSDVSAFLVSIFATWAATQPSSWHYSFGYHRAEILGALVSVLTIWAVTGALVFEAFQRTLNPVRVDGKLMFIIASAGVMFNIVIALTLGVHAHLGHSHGPGGCSGQDHDRAQHHNHGHSHGSTKGKNKYNGCSHSHSHSHSNGHSAGHHGQHQQALRGGSSNQSAGECCVADRRQARVDYYHHHHHHQAEGDCQHEPGLSHSHSSCQSPHDCDDHSHSEDEACHDHAHSSSSGSKAQAMAAVPHQESVVINMPNMPADVSGCGQQGHTLTSCCTSQQSGSTEIEVRYELPMSTVPADSHVAGAAAAAGTAAHVPANHGAHGGGGHDHGSINLRSAVLHVVGDLLQSVGVAIAGGLIWLHQDDPRWYLADPICTFGFSIVVLLTTKSVLRDIVHVLMERTPQHMDIPAVSRVILGMEGIRDVHDLHIWNISTSMKPVLTAHVHIGPDADPTVVLQKLEEFVRGLGIDHSTIQICNPQRSLEAQLPAAEDEVLPEQQPCSQLLASTAQSEPSHKLLKAQ